ncbi:hypothetical protein WICANDRAFT_81458 [Wickerhamomyces anomalus NRRL Y-366-8]|uniref:Symplekin/Pta1 N-terminal domain-containing protein n=1 Tax=Wickerhamomyces anomalus (strain ATCC 58044 / CBS 1984 / NCYC 433 / NRRL Y-366-8) TaxID=683960 RepID=A0A1E3NW65_WICAA|nr:uncharacterized protein WICANDRAFT_81458 [Wickerhamomyces anomalus NRRL Y-366-8]ODQ57240.1 hypothetical protein WICANDRAFT_81458 [Wickerhamomyces anomalus NRRL Y-366-8]
MNIIDQLNQSKQLVQRDPKTLPTVLKIIIPIATQQPSSNDLSIHQWCSQFFNDITSPANKDFSFHQRQETSSMILPALIHLSKINDVLIFKNVVLTSTNIYDCIFDLVAKTSNSLIWQDFDHLKQTIIAAWSSTYPLVPSNDSSLDESRSIGVKLTILKFISKIIIIQTSNIVSKDPRRSNNNNSNEISIANVNENHTVINKNVLDAEAKGLLDLLINYLNDEEFLIPQKFIGIFNALVIILQKRFQLFNTKILNSIISFNTSNKYQFSNDSNLKFKLMKRFMNRYLKNLLNYLTKSNLLSQQSPIYNKATNLINEINSSMDITRKRGLLNESIESNKKIKLENPPLQPSTNSLITNDNQYSSLYTLIESNNELRNFDVSQIPLKTLSNIAIATLLNVDMNSLISALSIVSARYADLINKTPPPPPPPSSTSIPEVKEPIDDTEKDDQDNNQILEMDNIESTYILPQPSPLSIQDKKTHLNLIIENFYKLSNTTTTSTTTSNTPDTSHKLNKIAITQWDSKSWLTILTRLATRGLSQHPQYADLIRESIFQYFLANIHDRIDIVIEWLNEEWFTEFITDRKTPTYLQWCEKLMDTLIPFLEMGDRRIFIRLLSEVPYLNAELVGKLKSLCIDPERSALGFQSLQFLVIYKPPVKEVCLEILKDFYENNEDLKERALGLLKKYLPEEYS